MCIPRTILEDVAGKDVLSPRIRWIDSSLAVFGLLGARITVADLTEGQLAGNRKRRDATAVPSRPIEPTCATFTG